MNAKRGFLRIWVVLSALFFLGIVGVSAPSIYEEFKGRQTEKLLSAGVLLPVECSEARGKSNVPPVPPGFIPVNESAAPTWIVSNTPPAAQSAGTDLYAAYGGKEITPAQSTSAIPPLPPGAVLIQSHSSGSKEPQPAYDYEVYESSYAGRKGYCWYSLKSFRSLYPEYKRIDDLALQEELYEKAGNPITHHHPWRHISQTLGVGFGVPAALLALAFAAIWAIAGFRVKPDPGIAP